MLDDFANLPWPNIAGFGTCVALVLFTFGPKLPFVVKFFGKSVQDMTGVTYLSTQVGGLRTDLQSESTARNTQHQENQAANKKLLDAVEKHAGDAAIHVGGRNER